MAKIHSRVDVYLGETLTWERATVTEDPRRHRLRVSHKGRIVASFTGADYKGREGTIARWEARDDEGALIEVSAAARAGCVPCGRK